MEASDPRPPRPLNPFEKFVAAIARVPKEEIDADKFEGVQQLTKRKTKSKPNPAHSGKHNRSG